MKAKTYCVERQIAWANRNHIDLIVSPLNSAAVGDWNGRDTRTAYTRTLAQNLYEPLSDQARVEFNAGNGDELGGHMRALYSSSALACNLFHALRDPAYLPCLLDALDLAAADAGSLQFEQKRRIMEAPQAQGFARDPNLDVVIRSTSSKHREIGIECKFREPWAGRPAGLKAKYLQIPTLWAGLPSLYAYARSLGAGAHDALNQHLHAAQLVKHLLGLRYENRLTGSDSFELVYLFYDVVGDEGSKHRHEVREFARAVESDGLRFRFISCQEFILRLLKHRSRFPAFIDYLTDRYL